MTTRGARVRVAIQIRVTFQCFSIVCLTLAWPFSVFAASPSIETCEPSVGQIAKEFHVQVTGAGLQNAKGMIFYSPHLKCVQWKPLSDYEAVGTIRVAENCPLGPSPYRISSPEGLSDLRTLYITPLVVERESQDRPHAVGKGNITICGVLESGDRDRYAIYRRKGERLSAEIVAVRLGARLLDTVLRIYGPDQNQLAMVDDTNLFQQDPAASLIAPKDGTYIIEVHESNYGGSSDSQYALHIGDFPMASVVYPAGGPVGQSISVTFPGNPSGPEQQTVSIPPEDQPFQLRAEHDGQISPTISPFRRSRMENVLEQEPNDNLDTIDQRPAEIPIAFNGILQHPGDIDLFLFNAVAGQPIVIDVFANRIGSPIDSRIAVLDSAGKEVASNDDWESHDSHLEFEPATSGRFTIRISDKLGFGREDAVYRIEVAKKQPALTPFLPRPQRKTQRGQSVSVPYGNRTLVRIGVRRSQIEGAVQLTWTDLPDGILATSDAISRDQFWVPVILEASASASLHPSLVRLNAETRTPRGDLLAGEFRQTVDLVAESADRVFQEVEVDRLALSVTPAIPFRVEIDKPTTALPRGGTLDLRIRVEREEGFTQPIKVQLPFLPPWVVAEPELIIPGDSSAGIYRVEARPQIEVPRRWSIAATAIVDTVSATEDTAAWDGREVASSLVSLDVASPPIDGQLTPIAAEQGSNVMVDCQVRKMGDAPPHLTATLEGLPNRISADSVVVGRDDDTISFRLEIAKDAPLGTFSGIQVRLIGEIDGQSVSYVVSPQSSLKVAAPGKLFKDDDGEVLTPLETLRHVQKSKLPEKP